MRQSQASSRSRASATRGSLGGGVCASTCKHVCAGSDRWSACTAAMSATAAAPEGQFLKARRHSPGARVGAEVGVDVVRVIGGRHALVAGDDVAGGRIAGLRHVPERDDAAPFMLSVPAGHRGPGVGHGANGDAPAVAVAEVAVHVGVDEVVDRLRPRPQGFLGLVRRARPQQVVQRVGPRGAAVGAGMAEGEAVPGVRITGNDRAVAGRHHLQGFRGRAAHVQGSRR